MRFLLLSDIHNNLRAVEKMRAQESNCFDALIVAGDIGSDSTHQIFDVLATFKCPVLYVYGNWDHKLSYDVSFGDPCHHLHLSPFKSGPITFAGFSGCTASWGQNPEALRLYKEIGDTHSEIIRALNDAENEAIRQKALIEAEYTASVDALTATSRRSPSQRKLKALDAERRRRNNALSKMVEDIKGADAYSQYLRQRSSISDEVLAWNRRSLSQVLTQVEAPRERTVIVTHDRLVKTQTDFAGVAVFLFGHRHGFAETSHQGAKFINVSALDLRRTIRPKVFLKGDRWKQYRNLNFGNYAVLEWDQSAGFKVTRIPLDIDSAWQESWEFETVFDMPDAPFLS
ncbi:metallophosphoesterase family protein [Rhizobium lusitanum]|uniref:metallophosphoesterase family protein n=1 Tax=Rhizobium lusitanum TaxID=293958 RepID=UPI00195CAD26|nr:metallophosphoesterase family protein [Rhizobium lusitanum]MBM7043593.1 metallophosphoesterase family protein [Rhizobium lusitanum]